MKEAVELVDGAKKVVSNTLEIQLQRDQIEWGVIKTALRESLSNYFWEKTRRRPMILPVLLQY
jgi:ribonuclease J